MSLKQFSFPLSRRLTEKESFNKVFASPKFARKTPFVSVVATPSGRDAPRLGIVVAKRNVKLAVMRNRLKRIIREAFRQQQTTLTGLDVVVVVRKDFTLCDEEKNKLPVLLRGVGDRNVRCFKN